MMIVRKCPYTGEEREMNIAVTHEQLDAWRGGELIQNAMPNLTPDEREFIKTGITPEQWEKVFNSVNHANNLVTKMTDNGV